MKLSGAAVQWIYMRPAPFFTDGIYHVYNRGVDKRKVFLRYGHYSRFIKTIRSILKTGSATQRPVYNQGLALKAKVRLLAYCLMPNHYHLLLKQIDDGGITEFMHKLDTSYTMYFNKNSQRSGRLFENTFKARTAPSEELLLHISRYIHLNPVICGLVKDAGDWPWSSYLDYIGNRSDPHTDTGPVLASFRDPLSYKDFVSDQVAYGQLLHHIESVKDEDMIFF